jgi:hypothetical protein
MRALGWALSALLSTPAAPASAADAAPPVHGSYDSPLGRVRLAGDGASYRGVLVAPSRACGFAAGEEVLRATLLDDSLAGELRVCLSGSGCRAREEWAPVVLLVGERALSGAVHVRAEGCRAPVGKRGGVAFARASGGGGAARARPATRREKARALLRDGARWLSEGSFERARQRFLDAIAIDASVPEAYNGVGVTYRMRNDLPRALEWYKRALGVDADFGDAYYNMACAYALGGRKDLALRYLQIAALNGYATAGGIDGDPDLESLRAEPAYRALVKAKM